MWLLFEFYLSTDIDNIKDKSLPAQGSHSSIFTDTAVQRTYYVKAV